ncbi:hypothetical protein HCU40_14685 [Pseudanabaena biceps]|nr:hypothetical protein [Pseudanabaena biceps]
MITSNLGNLKKLSSNWFSILLVAIIILGIVLRCINIDGRVYWGDEIVTSLRMSGYTTEEVVQNLSSKSSFSVLDLQEYQRPNAKNDLTTTVKGLIVEEAQHTPIYFILARLWIQLFNNFTNGVTAIRSFSVFISLVSFPCLYWLCCELFKSHYVGLISVAMFAVSPFNFVYAQEARPPVIWILGIIISNALFLRCIRLNTKFDWIAYAISITFNLYTFLFSFLVFVGHGIYIFIIQKFKPTKLVISYLIAIILGIVGFVPWILILFSNLKTISSAIGWSSEKIGALNLLRMTLNNLRDVYFSLGDGYAYLTFILLIVIGFSLYHLINTSSSKVSYFVLILFGMNIVSILLPDIINGGTKRSAASRYFIASYLGLNLALAYLFTSFTSSLSSFSKHIKIFNNLVVTSLLALGLISCISISQSGVSFNQATYRNIDSISKSISKYEDPLVIANYKYTNNVIGMIGLSYKIRPNTQFQIFDNNYQKLDVSTSKSIFVYGGNNDGFIETIKDTYEPQLIFDDRNNLCCSETLWYLKPRQG